MAAGTDGNGSLRRWFVARWGWIEPRRGRVAVLSIACVGIGFLIWQLSGSDAKAVQSIPGDSMSRAPSLAGDVDVTKWILLDYLLMLLVAVALFSALLLPRRHLGMERRWNAPRPSRSTAQERWFLLGVTSTSLFFVADVLETSILWGVASDVAADRTVSDGVREVMNGAHNVKWFAFAIAVIAVAARWSRRTPPLPGTQPMSASPTTAEAVPTPPPPPDAAPAPDAAPESDAAPATVGDAAAPAEVDDKVAVDEPEPIEDLGAVPKADWNAANHAPMQIAFESDGEASEIGVTYEPPDPARRVTAPDETSTGSADVDTTPVAPDDGEPAQEGSNPEASTRNEADRPATAADDWKPSKDRFGIAVSGGGIRSASFAFGVFDVLREKRLLGEARYVTTVSGGGYAASALEHANRMGEDPTALTIPRLRRRLNYLLPDMRTSFSGLVRVLLGLLLNLGILYLVIFMVASPVGWAIGSPLIQEGLRYEGPVVTDVITDENDPDDDGADERNERWKRTPADTEKGGCGLDVVPDSAPTVVRVRTDEFDLDDQVVSSIEFGLDVTTQCVAIDHGDFDDRAWTFDVVTTETGLIRIDDGVAEIIRQPKLGAVDALPARRCACVPVDIERIVDVTVPDIDLTENALIADRRNSLGQLVEPISPVVTTPASIVDLRGDLDWDTRHTMIPALLGLAMVLAWLVSGMNVVVADPERLRRATLAGRWAGWAFLAALAMFVALPLLIDVVPDRVTEGLVAGPSDAQTGAFAWFPTGANPILAWPVLAVATIVRFFQQQRSVAKMADKPDASKKRNAVAFVSKVVAVLTRLAVGVVLVALVIGTSTLIMATAALNGPFGNNVWISREIFSFRIPWPPELAMWAGIIIIALACRTAFAAGTWSLGPYYRRQLRWAFMGDATGYDAFDGSSPDGRTAAADDSDATPTPEQLRAGYLAGTDAELVVCCAANVLGSDRAPSGRRAVSFSASRSWIGGPELGWVRTPEYLNKMSPARKTDVTVSALTAISGAAASPAMGKQSLGPLGSVLALLNVRLGAWLPHPKAVLNMSSKPSERYGDGPTTWKHTPGWPYFVREVIRRHKQEAAYVYVSDGGHWENLGLVESIRRGCNTIIVISAAGDGASSHATLAEAVEIARTDLAVDIEFDDAWTMRPTAGGPPEATLPSGRQFLRQRGDDPEIGRVAPRGWTFGTFRRRGVPHPHDTGRILLIEATMVDGLALDVHAYAEGHPEFPDINTGDQFFANRDFESYRMLGATLAERALAADPDGRTLTAQITASRFRSSEE